MFETWLSLFDSPSLISDITPTGHTLHHKPRIDKLGGGVEDFHKDITSMWMLKSPQRTLGGTQDM